MPNLLIMEYPPSITSLNTTFMESLDSMKLFLQHNTLQYQPYLSDYPSYSQWLPKTLFGICFTTSILLFHWLFFPDILISTKQSLTQTLSTLSKNRAPTAKTTAVLKRQMTSIGRLSHRAETKENPCIITFFAAMANQSGRELKLKEFEELWENRVMSRHERFRSRISLEDDRYFEVTDNHFNTYAKELPHPQTHFVDLQNRIEEMLSTPINVNERLWEASISTGTIGSSGAISDHIISKMNDPSYDLETIAMFRVHHSLGDGVSNSVALGDVSDEAQKLRDAVMEEIRKRKQQQKLHHHRTKLYLFDKLMTMLKLVYFYVFGSIKALSLQAYRMMTCINPFDSILNSSDIPVGYRSVSWRDAAPLEEVRKVAKWFGSKVTINDVFVSCTSAAIAKQLIEHQTKHPQKNNPKLPSTVNVCIPVHLTGGVLLPGQSLGNKIGAFVTKVPACTSDPSSKRLLHVSSAIQEGKTTPVPLISWYIAKFFSDLMPEPIANDAMLKGNAHAVAVITNVRGFPFQVHWNGRPVKYLSAFLPLPPGIPIGIVVQSYDGNMSFTVDSDKRAVPDADKFAQWMLEEYKRLKREAGMVKGEKE